MSEQSAGNERLPEPTSPFLSGDILAFPVVEGEVATVVFIHGGKAAVKLTEPSDVVDAWTDANLFEMTAREKVGDIDEENPYIPMEVELPPVIIVPIEDAEHTMTKCLVERVVDTIDPKGRPVQRLLLREVETEGDGFKPGSQFDVWRFPLQTAFHFLTIDGEQADGIDWQLATTVEVEPDWYKG